ncbi:hypothetical protein Tco_1349195, partial [Tanacetum coccineum]
FLNMNFGVALQFGRLREPLMGLLGTSIALLRSEDVAAMFEAESNVREMKSVGKIPHSRKCSHEAKVGELVNMNDSVDA